MLFRSMADIHVYHTKVTNLLGQFNSKLVMDSGNRVEGSPEKNGENPLFSWSRLLDYVKLCSYDFFNGMTLKLL